MRTNVARILGIRVVSRDMRVLVERVSGMWNTDTKDGALVRCESGDSWFTIGYVYS
jgi:hypothetical protein